MTQKQQPFDTAEWAALYAAGALPPDECAAFEARLAAGDPECLAELNQLNPVMDSLVGGINPVVPVPAVRDGLMQRIAAEASAGGGGVAESPSTVESSAAGPALRHGLSIDLARDAQWEPTEIPGITRRILNVDPERRQYTALLRCVAGTIFPPHRHAGLEQTLLLEGDIQIDNLELGPGDFQRGGAGSRHVRQLTRRGCLLLVIAPLEHAASP